MKVFPYKAIKAEDAGEGTSGLNVRWLITKEVGAPNFAMRLFEVEPSGYSPFHSHPWEHEVFVLEGEGVVIGGSEEKSFKKDDVIFVPPDEKHQFKNNGEKIVRFLCLVPYHDK